MGTFFNIYYSKSAMDHVSTLLPLDIGTHQPITFPSHEPAAPAGLNVTFSFVFKTKLNTLVKMHGYHMNNQLQVIQS
ncbi:UNVERIFIED_CONTAM: hypothetical protein FKN15_044808 [Acipenser sinensis]